MSDIIFDEERMAEPLTKGEAYLLFSKLKRINAFTAIAIIDLRSGKLTETMDALMSLRRVSEEFEKELDTLVNVTRDYEDD